MDDRVAALEARIAELEHQLAPPPTSTPTSSRRHLLRLAGATMVGTAVGMMSTRAASADEGLGVVGAPTTSADVIRHSYTGGSTTDSGMVFQAGTTFSSNFSTYPAALAGWSGMGAQPANGVYGYAAGADRVGVVGWNSESGGIGVLGRCDAGSGVLGVTTSGEAVRATATSGTAVRAISSNRAVFAEGDVVGVEAIAGAPGGVAVRAVGIETGIYADSVLGSAVQAWGVYGLEVLSASRAALRLHDMTTAGPDRLDAHQIGEIDFAGGDLWLCVDDGTPGRWITLGGTSAAGAFHAIAPVRVYDSRLSIPDPGVMTNGSSRVVSVRDARDATGAVATADVVPVGATAIAYNLTITETTASGFLSVAPGDAVSSTASSINWSATGQNLANGLVVKLDDQRRVKVFAGGGGSTHVVIDVLGYYR